MKIVNEEKEYLVNLLMYARSTYDLLEIVKNILINLKLSSLNSKLKNFKHFQFTFFGLINKTIGLLEIVCYKLEFLSEKYSELYEINLETKNCLLEIKKSYEYIYAGKIIQGKNFIIECFDDYEIIFDKIKKQCFKLL